MAFYDFRKIIRKLPGKVIREIPLPKPAVTQGFGTRGQIGGICRELGLKSVLLLTDCGLENGCAAIQEADTERLIRMVDADSINYSPVKTFRDEALKKILEHIHRGA